MAKPAIIKARVNRLLGPNDTSHFPVRKGKTVYIHEKEPPDKGRLIVSDDVHGMTGTYSIPADSVDFRG